MSSPAEIKKKFKDIAKAAKGGEWPSKVDNFAKTVTHPKNWLGESRDHIALAQTLLPSIKYRHELLIGYMNRKETPKSLPVDFTSNYFFACAIASENIFKSVICFNNLEEIKEAILNTNKTPRLLLGHDLVDLARRANFSINIDLEFLLKFLTRYGIWSGKYRLPIHNDHYAVAEKLSDGNHYMFGGYNPAKVGIYLDLCEELYKWAKLEIS